MNEWHGYILLRRPPGLTNAEWQAVLAALRRVWDTRPDDPQPAKRLHWRASRDGRAVLVEATFDRRDLSAGDLQRLPRYIHNVVPRLPVETIASGLQDSVTVLGRDFVARKASGKAARAYLAANRQDWDDDEATVNDA